MVAGCAAPPGGRAWSGVLDARGLLLGGTPVRTPGMEAEGGRRVRASALNFVECVTRGLGRAEIWSHWSWVPGGASPRLRLTVPFRPHPPQVAEGGLAREPLQLLEVSPRKRLPAGPEQDPCGSRPAPEGAGAGAEQGHSAGGGGWCRHCHTKLAELKRQAWKLVSGPGTPLRVSDASSGWPLGAGPMLELGRAWGPERGEVPPSVFTHVFPSLRLSFPFCNAACVSEDSLS